MARMGDGGGELSSPSEIAIGGGVVGGGMIIMFFFFHERSR